LLQIGKVRCAKILVQEAKKFLVNNTTSLEIEFCIFDDETTEYFKKEFTRFTWSNCMIELQVSELSGAINGILIFL
jgi:hypothetical protein